MASKQVQDLLVRLKIDGLEGLDSLKGAFRELAKTIGPTEQVIEKARQSIIEFGEAGNKSEQLIKGQIEAFKGLRTQATQGGKVYKELTADIKRLEGAAYGASPAVEAQRKALTALGLSADATALQIEQAINSLINLRGEVRVDSQAFDNFGKSIAELTDRFRAVNQEAQNFAQAQQRIARPIGATSAAARQQIRDLDLVTESLREQRDALGALEGEARIKSGAASLAARQAPASGRRTFEEAVSEAAFGGDIKKLLPSKDIKAALDEVAKEIANFQQEIETKLSRKIQVSFQETARAGRESARAMAAAFSDPELINVFNQFDRRLGKLPNTTAGLEQELSELTVQLNNVERGSSRYVEVSNRMAEIQKELQRELTGTTEAFRKLDIAQAGVERRAEKRAAIQEYYGTISERMSERATRPRQGLAPGVGGFRDPVTGAIIARGRHTPGRIRVEEAAYQLPIGPQPSAIPRADRKAEIRDRIENYKQITAENAALREQAAIRRSVERARVKAAAGAMATVQEPARGTSALFQGIAEIGLVGTRQQTELIGKSYSDVADSIRKVSAASNGSIQSLQAQRNAWQTLRDRLEPTSGLFKQVSRDIEQVDRRLEKLQQTQRRRMTGMQMAQAAGAALSGGIFGGPEGFLGGAIGSAFGVGGAFAGAAIGAQISGFRKQAGAIGEYVAQLNLAKTTLAQAAVNQDEYNRLLQLARSVSSDYAVALRPSIEGLAQVATAAAANNLTFKETEAIYRGIVASGVAFGKSQGDLDALIRATTQVLSKGKVSAEEMSGQIGERLPGAVAKFAAATERTLPELAKAFEQGEVTIADFVKFATDQFEEYDDVAQLIAEGPEKAGIRLQIALDTAAENFGGFFQRTGSKLQDFFTNIVEGFNENSEQIKQFVTTWVNAGAAIIDVLSRIAGAFGRMMQRVGVFVKANPFLGIAQNVFGGLFSGLKFQGKFKPEDLFPEFTPPRFGGGDAVDLTGGGGAEDSSKAKAEADKAAREEERIQQQLRNLAMETQGTQQLAFIKGKIAEAEIAGNRELMIRLQGEARNQQILIQLQKSLAGVTDERVKQALLVKSQADLESAGIETAIEMEKQRLAVIKEQNNELFRRAGFTPQDKMREGAGAFDPSLPDLRVSPAESQMKKYREELEALANPINMAVTGANAIGDAFGQAFQSIITGSQSTQEALSNAFKAIGEAFIQMAVQIIAKQLAMIAFQTILKALGGGGSIGFSGAGPAQLPSGPGFAQGFSLPPLLPSANGNAFAQNGIQPFAMGGIVNRPTLFKYADGGAGRFGLMGEAGPEAIIPLKRGRDGRLGVAGGGNSTNVTVNVDASGSQVQGDPGQGQQLGRAIAAAVQTELIKQKRPGGLLAT